MNISGLNHATSGIQSTQSNAVDGIRKEQHRFERNVAEVARGGADDTDNTASRDKSLVEQREIVHSVRANARSLEAAGERIGTLIDIKV